MGALGQDIRYTLRSLSKSPMFTAVALISLSLGIGANTAIFSLMDQILLRLLPVKDPEQLVLVHKIGGDMGMVRGDDTLSFPMYEDLRDRNTVFNGLIAYMNTDMSLVYRGQTERISGDLVSGNYFDVLGVRSAIGRTLTPEDDRTPGAHAVTVLSYNFWTRRFNRDPRILNQTIVVNASPLTVIGVAQPGFTSADTNRSPDLFVPIMMKKQMTPAWDELFNRRALWLTAMGRLKPGMVGQQAQASINALYSALLQDEVRQLPAGMSKYAVDRFLRKQLSLIPGQQGRSELRRQFSTPLLVLSGMVGLVLLIACANVANLLVARAAARQKEIAVRLAIGASRWRIVRQLLVESTTLALAGGVLALLVAAWTGSILLHFLPSSIAGYNLSTNPDSRVLLFNFALAIFTGILFGLAPALQATRPSLAPTLKDGAGSVSAGSAHVRFRKTLVVAQVALSLLLLIGAGLFARSLYNLKSLNPGFRYDQLLTFSLDASLNGYPQQRSKNLYERLREDIGSVPGVHSAALGLIGLMSNDQASLTVTVEGYKAKDGEDMNPFANWVSPSYFSTIGLPIVAGREFRESDRKGTPKVAIINETSAKYFFADQNPLGRHIGIGRDNPDAEIVGVVRDAQQGGLREKPARWVYFPIQQTDETFGIEQAIFYVRAGGDPAVLTNSVRGTVQRLDPTLPIFGMRTMTAQVNDSIFLDRIVSLLSAFFGLLATLLAAVGLYGVMAYTVARRTREIGIRIALGAGRSTVVRIVMGEVSLLAGLGILIALPVSYPLSRLVESQLFGIRANDPLVVLGATAALAFVAMAAGYLPALRATRIDPMIALRYE